MLQVMPLVLPLPVHSSLHCPATEVRDQGHTEGPWGAIKHQH